MYENLSRFGDKGRVNGGMAIRITPFWGEFLGVD